MERIKWEDGIGTKEVLKRVKGGNTLGDAPNEKG